MLKQNVILAFYNGIRLAAGSAACSGESTDNWEADSYKIFDPSTDPQGTVGRRQ